jgi:hypothetical protein
MFIGKRVITVLLGIAIFTGVFLTVEAQKLKVLTIGNSFADSVFVYLPSIVKSVPGCEIVMQRANIGGCSLERHWKEVEKSEKDGNYKPYLNKYTLKELLSQEKWDIVSIQQVSSNSFKLETYEPWFANLYNYIHKFAPQAEVVIQMTWSYRPEHIAFGNWGVKNPDDMFRKLYKNYIFMADKYNCRTIPTGLAIHLARKKQTLKFIPEPKPDLSKYNYPELPKSPAAAFIVGYRWRTNNDGSRKLVSDLIHLNKRGQYLQACVWFSKLFAKPCSLIKFVPEGMDIKDADFLRKIAQEAVDQSNEELSVKYEQ